MSDTPNETSGTVCPSCGRIDQIDVAATVWVRITDNGTDADASSDGHHEYDGASAASCGAAGGPARCARLNLAADDSTHPQASGFIRAGGGLPKSTVPIRHSSYSNRDYAVLSQRQESLG